MSDIENTDPQPTVEQNDSPIESVDIPIEDVDTTPDDETSTPESSEVSEGTLSKSSSTRSLNVDDDAPAETLVPILRARIVELEAEVADLRRQLGLNDTTHEDLKLELEDLRDQLKRQEQLLIEAQTGASAAKTLKAVKSSKAATAQDGEENPIPHARAGFRKFGEMTLRMRRNREEKLLAVRSQIVAWINRLLVPEPLITSEDFMERLATGTMLCNLAMVIDASAIPVLGRIHTKALPYSIYAHENVTSFLNVCYSWGMKKVECFTPQDLLNSNQANRNERLVVDTLLSLSRVVHAKFGIEPPWIVKAEIMIDQSENDHHDKTSGMNDDEIDKLLEALQAYCAMHGIADVPKATERRGQFEFSDGTLAHIRLFECGDLDIDADDGSKRDKASILDAIQDGELALLVRHNNAWEEMQHFLRDHSGGKKIDPTVVVAGTAGEQSAKARGMSVFDVAPLVAKEQEEEPELPEPVELDVLHELYHTDINYDEEDEDDDYDEDYEDEEAAAAAAAAADAAAKAAFPMKSMRQGTYTDGSTNTAADEGVEDEDDEFNPLGNSEFLKGVGADEDLQDVLNKVRRNVSSRALGTEIDINNLDPNLQPISAIITTDDYKRFKNVTTKEISVMSDSDLQKLAEYTAKQEFFYLTALAVKMTHELRENAIQVVTNQELWRRAIDQNIAFHKFHTFIYTEITKSWLEQNSQERVHTKDGMNLRNHREQMIANIKERQRAKVESSSLKQ